MIVAGHLARVRSNLDTLDGFFEAHHDSLRWTRPRGGSVGLARLLCAPAATAFCDDLLARAGILLVPSGLFCWQDHHVRLGLGRESLPEVLERFSDYLETR